MYKHGDSCPLCGGGLLCEKVIEESFNYKGHSLAVPDYHVLECPACGEAVVDKDSARRAEKMLKDFGRRIDGLLTATDIGYKKNSAQAAPDSGADGDGSWWRSERICPL